MWGLMERYVSQSDWYLTDTEHLPIGVARIFDLGGAQTTNHMQ